MVFCLLMRHFNKEKKNNRILGWAGWFLYPAYPNILLFFFLVY